MDQYHGSLNEEQEAFLDAILIEMAYIFAKSYPDELPPEVVKHLHPIFNRTIGRAFRKNFGEQYKWWLKEQKQVNDIVQTGRDYAASHVVALAEKVAEVTPPVSTQDLDEALKAISEPLMEVVRRLQQRTAPGQGEPEFRYPICPSPEEVGTSQ